MGKDIQKNLRDEDQRKVNNKAVAAPGGLGKGVEMIFAKLIRKYMGMKFGSGCQGKNGAIGCLDLVHSILREMGKTVPDEWRGLTIENYGQRPRGDRSETKDMLTDLGKELGREIPVAAKLGGDVLIMEQCGGGFFPALYIGNNHAIAAFSEQGVQCFQIDKNHKVISVWRIEEIKTEAKKG
jgi:hypothetical protein